MNQEQDIKIEHTSPTPPELGEEKTNLQIFYNEYLKFWKGLPLSDLGIIGLAFGILGLFFLRFVLGALACIFAFLAKTYRQDQSGFWLALGFGLLDITLFILIWMFFHLSQGGFWF